MKQWIEIWKKEQEGWLYEKGAIIGLLNLWTFFWGHGECEWRLVLGIHLEQINRVNIIIKCTERKLQSQIRSTLGALSKTQNTVHTLYMYALYIRLPILR